MRPSRRRALTSSSRPISSAILPFSIRSTVVPVTRTCMRQVRTALGAATVDPALLTAAEKLQTRAIQ